MALSVASFVSLFISGCGDPTIDAGDEATVRSSYERVVASLHKSKVQQQGFPLALLRAVSPAEYTPPRDDFDPASELRLATDRGILPAEGTDEYVAAVQRHAHRVDGMAPPSIVDVYVSQDGALLSRQEQWARNWQARTRIRSKNELEEAARRRALLGRFKAIKPAYWWEGGRPFLKFFMHNPLDVALDRVAVDFDLFDPSGNQMLGSARVEGVLRTALQPGVEGTVLIELSRYETLARPQFRNLGETLQVQLAFRNAWSQERSLIDRESADDDLTRKRNQAVINLLARIQVAKANLSKFRVAFAQR
ncbi:MAG: hypothetical protein DI537_05360 [Stutzerimonas stutzeri]|nr:MAG: hypothetical protein DI537_05360 [Stutzerimonas stutzeri]